ncbi:MAG: hypothetical protein ABIP39_15040 [Polyangiaceae bacterium]
MILMKNAALVAVVGLGITVTLVGGGCSSNTPATPRVAISSQLGQGDMVGVNDHAKCQLVTEPWVVIGDNTHPVSDGDQQGGSGVSVTCSVTPSGDGFTVAASASLTGQGSVVISGHVVGMANVTPQQQTNITAVFSKGDTGSFRDTACTIDFSSNVNMGFAPGRIWGQLTCPTATYDSQGRTCLGSAEFRFENCGGT